MTDEKIDPQTVTVPEVKPVSPKERALAIMHELALRKARKAVHDQQQKKNNNRIFFQ